MNNNLSSIVNPEFLQQLIHIAQTQKIDYKAQPAEVLKMLNAIDDLLKAFKNVAPEYKAQALQVCVIKALSDENGLIN